MTGNPYSHLCTVYVYDAGYLNINRIIKFCLIFIFLGFISLASNAQPDLENTIPSNYRVAKGTLTLSDAHYKLGQKSLRWDWVAGDTIIIDLTAAEEAVVNPQLVSGGTHHFKTFIYNEIKSKDTFSIKFYNWQGNPQFSFRFNINFNGWRRLLRNYQTDMQLIYETPSTTTSAAQWNIDKILLLAPLSGSGFVFIDDMNYMTSGERLESDYVMPDLHSKSIRPLYNSDLHYRIDSLNKLIVLPTPTTTELENAASVRQKILDAVPSKTPSASELQNAYNEYATYNIQFDENNNIKGKYITSPSVIMNMLTILTNHAKNTNDELSKEKVINLLKLFLDCGFAEGSGLWFAGYQSGGYNSIDFFRTLANAYSFLPADLRNEIWRWLKWCTDVNLGWDTEFDGNFNTDNFYVLAHGYLSTVIYSADGASTVKDMKCLKQFIEKFLTPQKGTSDGMKIDGTGFHHNAHYNNYMYAFGMLIDTIMRPFIATPFQVNEQAYNNLMKVAYGQYISSNPVEFANSLSGRITFFTDVRIRTPTLAKIGGGIMNTSYDPVAAGMYVRMTNNSSIFPGVSAEPFPTGFWQMNYSPAAVYRRDNWVATMRGSTSTFWGSEIYADANVYGRYQAYGALEIIYTNGLAASGMQREGWDWNKVPGTTTIEYPSDSLRSPTIEERNNLDFAGGTKFKAPVQTVPSDFILKDFHGEYGMYGLNFQQVANASVTHSSTFVFRKSFFCFGNKIVCVGSNINNNRSWRNTITTLFQGTLSSPSNAIEVDGAGITAFPASQSLSNTSAHRLLDAYKTGYYIMPGSTIQVQKKNQNSPDQSGSTATTTADYANAYIDHGKAPVDGKYAYVVLPNTTSAALSDFAAKMGSPSTREFDILQQDEHAHIVRENATGVTGFSLFTSNTSLTSNEVIKANDVPCVAMLQIKDDTLRINVVNPDINLVNNESTAIPITIKLYGEWLKAANIPAKYASVISTDNNETMLMFSVADGLPAEITLVNFSSNVLPLSSLTLKGNIDANAGRNVLTMEFENNDSADYALESKLTESVTWNTIEAKKIGGADTKQSFVFYHSNPLAGENQYRIKCTDIDGKIKYSNIVTLKNSLANDIVIAPNPATNEFSIILKDKPAKSLQWNLVDGSGKIVKTGSIANLRENVNVRTLTPGIYYIRFVNGRYFPVVIMK